jgi:N-acylneuraminate cytidylyltransferase
MDKTIEVLAIIPARGGSKRIPRKNILELGGKPLIAHTIAHGKDSKHITRVIVSTEDEEIAAVAKEWGADVPFIRPLEFAQDDTPDFPVFRHALLHLEKTESYVPDIVVQLRPTSPLRKVEDIDRAIEMLINNPDADSVRTIMVAEPSPYKMYTLDDAGYVTPLLKAPGTAEGYNGPTQALPKAYRHIGTADVMWPKTILEKNSISGTNILGCLVSEAYTGIDTPQNWEYYEFLMSRRKQ